jgi:hypothetical protein
LVTYTLGAFGYNKISKQNITAERATEDAEDKNK